MENNDKVQQSTPKRRKNTSSNLLSRSKKFKEREQDKTKWNKKFSVTEGHKIIEECSKCCYRKHQNENKCNCLLDAAYRYALF
jgi:pSer/pThr/pTyr-binding forkhead associated (FHA) protein